MVEEMHDVHIAGNEREGSKWQLGENERLRARDRTRCQYCLFTLVSHIEYNWEKMRGNNSQSDSVSSNNLLNPHLLIRPCFRTGLELCSCWLAPAAKMCSNAAQMCSSAIGRLPGGSASFQGPLKMRKITGCDSHGPLFYVFINISFLFFLLPLPNPVI